MRIAIGNFLSNAVRMAPQGSSVGIDWGRLDDWAWITVIDEGPGLAPHLHARVFERGWQGHHERERGAGNGEAGLGLTIARQLTEAQGGAVTVESEEGGGSVFTVWLPLEIGADPEGGHRTRSRPSCITPLVRALAHRLGHGATPHVAVSRLRDVLE